MRLFVTGGSTFDPVIGRDLYGLGFTILNAYGLTETSGGATVVRPNDRFNASVGQPFPGVEIRIFKQDDDSAAAETGAREEKDDGEVLIRGPIIMREYFNRPDATREALRDGWLYTGDLGRLDAKGRLYITGRKKEIIVLSSGKNLYPKRSRRTIVRTHSSRRSASSVSAALVNPRPNGCMRSSCLMRMSSARKASSISRNCSGSKSRTCPCRCRRTSGF
jgi:long-chain acyl-CoA synthetase